MLPGAFISLASERSEETKLWGGGGGIVCDQWLAPKALFAQSVPAPVGWNEGASN